MFNAIKSERGILTTFRWVRWSHAGRQVASRPVDLHPIITINFASTRIQGIRLIQNQSLAIPFLFIILDNVQRPCYEITLTINAQIG